MPCWLLLESGFLCCCKSLAFLIQRHLDYILRYPPALSTL